MAETTKHSEDRRENLERLRALGVETRPSRYAYTHTVTKAVAAFSSLDSAALGAEKFLVAVPGRLTALRRMGKASFADISDGRARLQIYIKKGVTDDRSLEIFSHCDLGDFVGARGALFRTRMGELTIEASEITFLSKALRPLPEKWHGLADVETRHRQRYLDLLANEESRKVFEIRARLTRAMREFLDARDYLEVETPMMHTLAGGALAKPFRTHHNALDIDLYLRIAPELHLKRLVVGGFERIYEINRNFRNEGISPIHNPEFTMMELYQCYSNFEDLITLAEEMLTHCVARATGNLETEFRERKISWERPWARMRYDEALAQRVPGFSPADIENESRLRALAKEHGVDIASAETSWDVLDALFSRLVEPHLFLPTFITHLPRALSPLAKAEAPSSPWAGRFEIYAGGMEIGNAYSEQNDPDEQRARFEEQAARDPLCQVDEDYLTALEHGMPPAGGLGVGMDRFAMVAAGALSIREVVFFPLLRPSAK